jgi:hypothetical protein
MDYIVGIIHISSSWVFLVDTFWNNEAEMFEYRTMRFYNINWIEIRLGIPNIYEIQLPVYKSIAS